MSTCDMRVVVALQLVRETTSNHALQVERQPTSQRIPRDDARECFAGCIADHRVDHLRCGITLLRSDPCRSLRDARRLWRQSCAGHSTILRAQSREID